MHSEEKLEVARLLNEAYSCRVNNLPRSFELAYEALRRSKHLDDAQLIADSLSRLSLFLMITGQYDQALEAGNEALGLYRVIGDDQGLAEAKYSIAGVYYKTDNFHLGLIYLIDCLEVFQRTGDLHNQARVHKSLGTIYEYFGDEKSAIKSYELCIEIARKVGDTNLESNAYNPLSGIYLDQGNLAEADELIERAIAMKQTTEDVRGMAFALYGKAKVLMHQGNFGRAEALFLESLRIHDEMGERLGAGMVYHKLGVLYHKVNDIPKSEYWLQKAIAFGAQYNLAFIRYKSYHLLYLIRKAQGDHAGALEHLESYLKVKEAVINTQTRKIIESYEVVSRMEALHKEAQLQKEKAEILEKKNKAEHASRVKQEFLSTMSHEIRTPLNAVITIAGLMENRLDPEEQRLLDSLRFSANNLLMIINDILDFSKLESGKVQLEFLATDIRKLLESVRNTYQAWAQEKGLTLRIAVAPEVSKYYLLDSTKMTQILGNLLSNAIKFTEAGSVEMSIERIQQHGDRDLLLFKVMDTGIGIPNDFLSEIFDSFSQPKSYTTKRKGGSGLGLSIVRKLIELHGSNIYVSSEEGKGSTFFFTLGLKQSEAPASDTVVQVGESLAGQKVLLAEDNAINAMVARKLMSNWGIEVDHASDGREALNKSLTKKYDYILMDIHMPEIDGFEVSSRIRGSRNVNKRTPIFALTADVTANQREDYLFVFDCFLLKPIEKEKLYEAFLSHRQ